MWFDVEPVPLSFTESSPFHLENVVVIEAPRARVFEILATGEGQREWFKDFVGCRWYGSGRGVGAEREIALKLLQVKERFLAWDQDERLAFHIYAVTVPLVTAMVEDWSLESIGPDKTRFTWRVHYRPSLLMQLAHPIVRGVFARMFKASAEGLVRWAAAHPKVR
jgi:uncharacterized protein YndB with AHSA1/START domain